MSNTRIFAGDLQFGEFRAILRGVVVKKIHNLAKGKMAVLKAPHNERKGTIRSSAGCSYENLQTLKLANW